jgi:hypothetical protein
MKIYKQTKNMTEGLTYGAIQDVTKAANYSAVQSDGKLKWTIPTVELQSDYYVEYQVTVDQLEASKLRKILTNTAVWDFESMSGDLVKGQDDSTDTTIKHYQDNSIVQMTLKEANAENSESESSEVQYVITFKRNEKATGDYTEINFENELPFTLNSADDITVKKNNKDLTDEEKAKYTVTYTGGDKPKFTITNLDLVGDTEYEVYFSGTLPELTADNPEIVNKASITYTYKENTGTTENGESTENGEGTENTDGNSSEVSGGTNDRYGNTIAKYHRLTNQVETDVTHLYLNIKKTVDEADPSQTFLFKIERFASEAASKAAEPVPEETFYTTLNCTDKEASRLVQVDKRGYYVITEVTDWSNTDYEKCTVSAAEKSHTLSLTQGSLTTNAAAKSAAFWLSRVQYLSTAFPTSFGCTISGTADSLPTDYPTVSFKNELSDYAYRSGQSYAENKIVKIVKKAG